MSLGCRHPKRRLIPTWRRFSGTAKNSGRIFLAEADGAVVGFICVLAKVLPSADDGIAPYAYISDLVVRAAHRGRGVGRELMMRAESFAREFGAKQLKVGVLVCAFILPPLAPLRMRRNIMPGRYPQRIVGSRG